MFMRDMSGGTEERPPSPVMRLVPASVASAVNTAPKANNDCVIRLLILERPDVLADLSDYPIVDSTRPRLRDNAANPEQAASHAPAYRPSHERQPATLSARSDRSASTSRRPARPWDHRSNVAADWPCDGAHPVRPASTRRRSCGS